VEDGFELLSLFEEETFVVGFKFEAVAMVKEVREEMLEEFDGESAGFTVFLSGSEKRIFVDMR